MLFAGKAFLLGRSDDDTVFNERRSAVVVERRDTEKTQGGLLEQAINRRTESGAFRNGHERGDERQPRQQGHHPELLPQSEESQELDHDGSLVLVAEGVGPRAPGRSLGEVRLAGLVTPAPERVAAGGSQNRGQRRQHAVEEHAEDEWADHAVDRAAKPQPESVGYGEERRHDEADGRQGSPKRERPDANIAAADEGEQPDDEKERSEREPE